MVHIELVILGLVWIGAGLGNAEVCGDLRGEVAGFSEPPEECGRVRRLVSNDLRTAFQRSGGDRVGLGGEGDVEFRPFDFGDVLIEVAGNGGGEVLFDGGSEPGGCGRALENVAREDGGR